MALIQGKWIDDIFVKEVPSGLVNGSNDTFTLSETPQDSYGLDLYVDGLFLIEGTHYTLSGTTITMTTPPAADVDIFVKYIKV